MGRYAAVSQQTRQNLIDAFWSLYQTKRIELITVKEITARAGYSRGTFYEYFLDVYDLLAQLEESILPARGSLPPLLPDGGRDAELLLATYLELFESYSRYYLVLLGDQGDPAFAGKIKARIKALVLEATAPPIGPELDYALEFILSAMIGTLMHWYRNDRNIPAERLMLLVSGFMTRGPLSSEWLPALTSAGHEPAD